MIKVSKEKWDKIHKDYKGKWDENSQTIPEEFKGKKNVLSGCISEEKSGLLTENIHFIIV